MRTLADLGQHPHAVKGQPRDGEAEGDADEGGHGVVEEDVGGEEEAHVAGVADPEDGLEVFGARGGAGFGVGGGGGGWLVGF